MKYLLIALLAVSGAASAVDFSGVVQRTQDSIVEIVAKDALGNEAYGTGFAVSKTEIATNFHIIEGAVSVAVKLRDGTVLSATIVGSDSAVDIALLRVDAKLKPITWANSDKVKVGQWAVVIGNPFRFERSVSVGVISAVNRTAPLQIVKFIQTDAAINPGNSGGVLLDERGRVIGIPSWGYSPIRASVGLGFCIPSNTAKATIEALRK